MDRKANTGTGDHLHTHVLQHQIADVGRHRPQPVGTLLGRVKLEGPRAHPIQGLHLDRAGPEGGREETLGGSPGAQRLRIGSRWCCHQPPSALLSNARLPPREAQLSRGLKLTCLSILGRYTEIKFKTLESPFPPDDGGSPNVTGSIWLIVLLEPSLLLRFYLAFPPTVKPGVLRHPTVTVELSISPSVCWF